MKKLFFLFLIFPLCLITGAQSNFLLYSFKGPVSVVDNGAESKAKVGKMLSKTSSLKLGPASTVTLICNEAAMFTLTKPGTYPMTRFNDSCKASNSSVNSNYIKYVWASMTKSSGDYGSNRKAYMSTVGAVSRSVNEIWIDPKLDTLNFAGGDFPLSWKCYSDAKNFDFFLYSSDNISEPIFKKTVSKQKIPFSEFHIHINPFKTYYWTVAVTGQENDELKVINGFSKEDVEKLVDKFKKQSITFEAPAEQAYRLGFMLEDAHYLADALRYYTKAATLDSANVLYRSTLMSFKKDYEIK